MILEKGQKEADWSGFERSEHGLVGGRTGGTGGTDGRRQEPTGSHWLQSRTTSQN